jgi:hypothetical protein
MLMAWHKQGKNGRKKEKYLFFALILEPEIRQYNER